MIKKNECKENKGQRTLTAAVLTSNFLKMANASSYNWLETAIFAISGAS